MLLCDPSVTETEPGTLLRVKTTSDYTELQARQGHRTTTCLKDYIHSFISVVPVSRVGLTELKPRSRLAPGGSGKFSMSWFVVPSSSKPEVLAFSPLSSL